MWSNLPSRLRKALHRGCCGICARGARAADCNHARLCGLHAQAACTALWLLHVLYAVPVRAAVVFGPACWLQKEEAELEKLREKERIRSGKELQVLCLLQLLCSQNSWSDPGACSLCSCMCESSAWPCWSRPRWRRWTALSSIISMHEFPTRQVQAGMEVQQEGAHVAQVSGVCRRGSCFDAKRHACRRQRSWRRAQPCGAAQRRAPGKRQRRRAPGSVSV